MTDQQAAQEKNVAPNKRKHLGSRDGLFKRNGWWWIDYTDAEGKRHRKKTAPDYQTARLVYRDTVAKIARGEVIGVREEGIRVKDFIERKYWPAIQPTSQHGKNSAPERSSTRNCCRASEE
jgi:hypothetical protein